MTANPYEKTRHPYEGNELLLPRPNRKMICNIDTDGGQERIDILLAKTNTNKYTFGYSIWFHNGRHADRPPNLEMGWFSSEQDAILYFLGMIIQYKQWFLPETLNAVQRAIHDNSQLSLFQ